MTVEFMLEPGGIGRPRPVVDGVANTAPSILLLWLEEDVDG